MSIDHTVVLLPALNDTATQTAALQAAVGKVAHVLTPDIRVRGTSPVILEEPGLAVLDAMKGAHSHQVVLLGHGWGSMVALQIATSHADRIAALLLSTNARLETIAVRSILSGVLALLPVSVVQQLGGRPADVAALLDQARPVDVKSLAARAAALALVMVGERDVANRGPSAALARSLPLGNLRVVPRAGPSWQAEHPHLVVELLVDFLSSPA